MIAWLFKFFLLLEAWVLILVAHAMPPGASALLIALILISIMVLWRLSHGVASWCVALALRLRDARPMDWGSQLTALTKEIAARAVSFNWSQPFPALAMGRDPAGAGEGTPILLVHGFFSSKGMWIRFRKRLVNAGFGPVYTVDLRRPFGHVVNMVPSLHDRIESILRETGKDKLILIAHSMGGLVSRQYLQAHGDGRVAQLITLGSPHRGTHLAKFALFPCVFDMRRRSGFLDDLAVLEAAHPPKVPTTSIYTLNDDLVYPPETSELPWAENIAVQAVGHVSLLFDKGVFQRVAALISPGS